MRLLVLDGTSLAVPDTAIESIASATTPTPTPNQTLAWLPDLVFGGTVTSIATPGQDRRTLCLRGGGAVDVPAAMHFVEDVDVLELPALLRPLDAATRPTGVVGITQLSDGLYVVCDPRELVTLADQGAP